MSIDRYRLADTVGDVPYYASRTTLRLIPQHTRVDYLDVVLVIAGEGYHVSHVAGRPDQIHRLTPGRIVLYRPADVVTIVGTGDAGLSICHVAFPLADWTAFSSYVGVSDDWKSTVSPPVFDVPTTDPAIVRPFETALHRFWDAPSLLDLVQFWIDVIPLLFRSHARPHRGAGAPSWLATALNRMRDEDNLRVGVPRLVELAHVTPSHLSVVTKRYYGRTPSRLVEDLRLRHAAILLSTTTHPIGEIATRCGFGTFAHFSAAFRRMHAVTPSAFRARALGRVGGALRDSESGAAPVAGPGD